MSAYHCPLCPLIFQHRSEAEWHLREEHRSRVDEEAGLRTELAAAAAPLDWERLRILRASPGRPSVTLLFRWLHQRQQQTVAELGQADQHNQLAWGLEAAWSALHSGKVDRLWVEHDYAVPGRILPGGLGVQTTIDPAEPGVIDDLVDALITKSAKLGIPVDVLDRGALDRAEPLAARIPLATSTTAVCRSLLLAAA